MTESATGRIQANQPKSTSLECPTLTDFQAPRTTALSPNGPPVDPFLNGNAASKNGHAGTKTGPGTKSGQGGTKAGVGSA